MRIALDIGHMGKRSRPLDRGSVNGIYREANLVLTYAKAAWEYLESKNHIVYLLCYDNYSNRQTFCDAIKADVHIQCHLNAPGGNYALIAYREDGHINNAKLSLIISRLLTANLSDVITKVEVNVLKENDRGFICLNPNFPSLLFEPLFIQNDDHLNFMLHEDGLNKIGVALAVAIDEWGKATNL